MSSPCLVPDGLYMNYSDPNSGHSGFRRVLPSLRFDESLRICSNEADEATEDVELYEADPRRLAMRAENSTARTFLANAHPDDVALVLVVEGKPVRVATDATEVVELGLALLLANADELEAAEVVEIPIAC